MKNIDMEDAHAIGHLSLIKIMDNPLSYAEIDEVALELLEQEADIAASELVGPNSIEWEKVQEQKFEELQNKFWIRFMAQYRDLRMKGKI